jgi:uncharacterized protein (TIGR03435 family)
LHAVRKLNVTIVGAALAVPIAIGLIGELPLSAQSLVPLVARRPAFEVASVKPIDRALMTRDHEGHQLTPTLFVDRTELMQYLVRAYVRPGDCNMKVALGQDCPVIVGATPPWVTLDRFEIQATLPRGSVTYSDTQIRNQDTPQLNLMLQVLLEDRFKLKVHRETRELPVYALVRDTTPLKLMPTPAGGERLRVADGSTIEAHGATQVLAMPRPDGTLARRMHFQASSMRDAANAFAPYFDRPVLDRTGLTGQYDFDVVWEVTTDAPPVPAVQNTSGRGGNYFNPFTGLTASELSMALKEVGLKVEAARASLEVLVIDHVEKPSAN